MGRWCRQLQHLSLVSVLLLVPVMRVLSVV
jgi:hypothetical protein